MRDYAHFNKAHRIVTVRTRIAQNVAISAQFAVRFVPIVPVGCGPRTEVANFRFSSGFCAGSSRVRNKLCSNRFYALLQNGKLLC